MRLSKDVFARVYYSNTKIKGVRVEDGDTVIPDRAYMGCTALKTVYVPDSVRRIGDAVLSGTDGVLVTFDGTERQWRMLTKPRKEKRDVTERGEWDKAPYYRTDETTVKSQSVTVTPLSGCKNLTVACKKDGVTLKINTQDK